MDATTKTEPKDTHNGVENAPTTMATTTTSAAAIAQVSEDAGRPPEESGASQSQASSIKPNKVYIGGLPDDTREADLHDCFGKFGTVTSIELKTGYGFVEFNSRAAAEKAVSVYHEGSFLGNTIRVELSHGGGKASSKLLAEPGACFKCGQHGHWARECPNHVVVLQRRGWNDRSASYGTLHSRGDSFSRANAAPLPAPRDDYRSGNRRQDDYAPTGRDYVPRERDLRRPGSPYYDYSRPAAPLAHGYEDRRYPTGPARSNYPPDRPPSPYGVAQRGTGALPPSRDFARGYERAPIPYEPRALSHHVAPYADAGSFARRSEPYPPSLQSISSSQPYSAYPPTRDHNGRRSPPPAPRVGGRYQEYNGPSGYDRPYERRRSASPLPAYRDGGSQPPTAHLTGNGYSRAGAAPYGRSQQYGPGYGDRGPSAPRVHAPHSNVPMANSNANSRAGERDYRPYRG